MNGDSVSVLKLFQVFERINRRPVVEKNFHRSRIMVNGQNNSDIAVKNARRGFPSLCPYNVIIILDLHDLVALAENPCTEFKFVFFRRRRIHHLLQRTVEIHRTELTLFGRAYNLNVGDGIIAVCFRKTARIKLYHRIGGGKQIFPLQEEKVPVGDVQFGILPFNYPVSIRDNQAFECLTEYPCQLDNRQKTAGDNIVKHISRSYGRKLIAVADKHKTAPERQSVQKPPEKLNVYHGKLVHDHSIGFKGIAHIP